MEANAKANASIHHAEFLENQITDPANPGIQDQKAVFLDPESYKAEALKTGADGHIVLIPEPSEDPRDPLNWSFKKRHTMLAIVVACSFLPDYGSVTGAATLAPQAE